MTVRTTRVWPIQPYVPAMPIVKDDLADSIDRAHSADAIPRLTEWVNRLGIEVLSTDVGVRAEYNAVVRVEMPSVEGNVPYDFLAEVEGYKDQTHCARCGTELPGIAKFCMECGTPVAPQLGLGVNGVHMPAAIPLDKATILAYAIEYDMIMQERSKARKLSADLELPLRNIDKALWAYSERQGKALSRSAQPPHETAQWGAVVG